MTGRAEPTNDAVSEKLLACAKLARIPPNNRDSFMKLMFEVVWPLWLEAPTGKGSELASPLGDLKKIARHTRAALAAVRAADATTRGFFEAQLGETLSEHADRLTELLVTAEHLLTIGKRTRGREVRHSSRRGCVRFHDPFEELAARTYEVVCSLDGILTVNKNAGGSSLAPGSFLNVLQVLASIVPAGLVPKAPSLGALQRIKSIVDGKLRKAG